MYTSLRTALSAMAAGMIQVDIISNNLANVNTTAFRKERTGTQSFADIFREYKTETGVGPVIIAGVTPGKGAKVLPTWRSLEPGTIRYTGDSCHVAIEGRGYFAVETQAGIRFTRDGRFQVNAGGWLVTVDGYRVLGEAGPIQVGAGLPAINNDGTVTADGEMAGRITVVDFADENGLLKEGNNLYRVTEQSGPAMPLEARLLPGSLEGSNVDVMWEMAELISTTRFYEMNQKVVTAADDLLGKLANEVGRV
ncbi:MAG TPA: flagellar hook-basal body protein [Firmicutes bacterium]|nr:flagellar hook-basal body protein [Bacillota bacterium]